MVYRSLAVQGLASGNAQVYHPTVTSDERMMGLLAGRSPASRLATEPSVETPPSLLERLRHPDDRAAWAHFVDLYTPVLFAFAGRLGLQEADAADLVQDVFLLLMRTLPQFTYDPQKSFRAWLWTVMRNKVAAHRRGPQPHSAGLSGVADSDEMERAWETEYRQRLV